MQNKSKLIENIKLYLWLVAGSVITALAINLFLVPYRIAPGGVTGIATVIYYLIGERLPVGTIMLVLNVPLFLFGFRYIGKSFVVRTIFSTIFLSLAIDVLEPYTNAFVYKYLTVPGQETTPPDLLLYSIFGGFLMGLGLGVVFREKATTGGTDMAARIVNHFLPGFTMGQLLLFIDASVVIFAAIAFKSFTLGLYAIVTLFITSKVIDAILEGVNFAKALFIISDRSDEIAGRIMKELDRGVTALRGKGMYTGTDKQVLFCVVDRAQMPQIKSIVAEIDPKAFVILTDIREVLGEGF